MKTRVAIQLGALLALSAGPAAAQLVPTVGFTTHGVLDACVVSLKSATGPRWLLNGGGCYYGSRLGFRGAEDLGDGLRAYFVLEHGFSADNGQVAQGGRFWGRRALVGFSGGFGSVEAGREYAPAFYLINQVDPMLTGIGSGLATIWSGSASTASGRTDNSITYQTPSMAGVTVRLIVAPGEQAAPAAARGGRTQGLGITYRGQKLYAALSYANVANAADTGNDRATTLGLKYDFGPVVLAGIAQSGGWEGTRTAAAPSSATAIFSRSFKSYLIGGTWKLGLNSLAATFKRYDDRTTADYDADVWTLTYVHVLSKRTQLYAGVTRLKNARASSYGASDGNGAYTGTAPGGASRALDLGITHFF
jgi:general bacterial porin, GBP family